MSGDILWDEESTLPDAPLIVDTGCPSQIDALFYGELMALRISETQTDNAP